MIVTFKAYGIGVKFVTGTEPEDYENAIDERTKAIYVESISNPAYLVSDIPALAKVGSVIFHSLIIWFTLTSHRSPMITASPLSLIIHSEWEVEPILSRLLSFTHLTTGYLIQPIKLDADIVGTSLISHYSPDFIRRFR